MVSSKLNDRQKLFCEEFLICGVAAEAYRRAGYANKNPDVAAAKLMNNPLVEEYLAKRRAGFYDSKIAEADDVLRFFTAVMNNALTEEVVSCSFGVFVKDSKSASLRERIRAAELLAKRYRLLDNPDLDNNKTEHVKAVQDFVSALKAEKD